MSRLVPMNYSRAPLKSLLKLILVLGPRCCSLFVHSFISINNNITIYIFFGLGWKSSWISNFQVQFLIFRFAKLNSIIVYVFLGS